MKQKLVCRKLKGYDGKKVVEGKFKLNKTEAKHFDKYGFLSQKQTKKVIKRNKRC